MGTDPSAAQSRFSGSKNLRRPFVSIRRLPDGLRTYPAVAAFVFLDDQAHAGWLPRGDGHGGHVREMPARLSGQETAATALMAKMALADPRSPANPHLPTIGA